MTLSSPPASPPSPPPSPILFSTAAIRTASAAPASASIRETHSEDRWARRVLKGATRDFISERRFQIIAGVIAAGVTAWLIWTM